MADEAIQLGLVALYHQLAGDDDFDLNQLGDDSQADTMHTAPRAALKDLSVAVDLTTWRDRYAANLAYVLARRCIKEGVVAVDEAKQELGVSIIGQFDATNTEAAEGALDDAVGRMLGSPHLTSDIADSFVTAFGTALGYTDLGDRIEFTGPAAETAAMFTDMSCMDFQLSASSMPGTITKAGTRTEVFKFDHEVCLPLSWNRLKATIDPRQWPTYNPGFFHSVQVLQHAQVGAGPGWTGVVQESVGVMPTTGKPAITNLTVTYHETKDVAITAYDLGPNVQGYPDDDAQVTVDYGFYGVVDEGVHRRMRMVKVLHIDGFDKYPKWIWWLWAQQISLSGYLFEEPAP